jgi:hypothetical protein
LIAVALVLLNPFLALVSPLAADQNDEVGIKTFVQAWVDTNRKQDVEGILALFAPDARVDSLLAGAKVGKEMYAGSLKTTHARGGVGNQPPSQGNPSHIPRAGSGGSRCGFRVGCPPTWKRSFLSELQTALDPEQAGRSLAHDRN